MADRTLRGRRAPLIGLACVLLLGALLVGARPDARPALADRPATGRFEVVGTKVFGPDGVQFIPMGMNMNGPNSFFNQSRTVGLSGQLQGPWGFNLIRVVTCLPTGCPFGGTYTDNNDLDGIVNEYTAKHMVVMIDYHQLPFGWAPDPSQMQAAVDFWTAQAERYRDNPYVWFNLFNEPESNYWNWLHPEWPKTAQRWKAQHQRVIDAIRATGAPNMIVVDETQGGQGAADWWSIGNSPDEDSGIISEGANLADPQHRTMFSFHPYDVWGFPNNQDFSCATRYTDAQRDARLRSYLDRIAARNLALMVGETGFRASESATTGVSSHGEQSPGTHPPCGSAMVLATEALFRAAASYDLGVVMWHAFELVWAGAQTYDLAGAPPTNLTHLGQLFYDYSWYQASRRGAVPPAPTSSTTTSTSATSTSTTMPSGGGGGGGAQAGNDVAGAVTVRAERLLDTRDGTGQGGVGVGHQPQAGETTTLRVTSVGQANVASDASAVVLNLTAVDATTDGFVTVWPCDRARPLASNLNYRPGAASANLVISKVSASGTVCLYTQRAVHLVADLQGWYPASAGLRALTPERLSDSRDGSGVRLAAGETRQVQVTGVGTSAVPAGAAAALLNVTSVDAAGGGFVTVWPCDQARPLASNLNVKAGRTVANLAVARLSAGGAVCLYANGPTHLVVDLLGWYPPGTALHPLSPQRLVDTRDGTGGPATALAIDEVRRLTVAGAGSPGVPSGASGVLLNVTVTEPTAGGYLTVWPCGQARPLASNVNYSAGQTVAGLVLVAPGEAGQVCVASHAPTHLVVDLEGWEG